MGEKAFTRGAGILLSITSLPSEYGMGTLGNAACSFVDLLVDLRQKYWQIPQFDETDCIDETYQSYSVFAGNPYLIDLGALITEGLVTKEEVRFFEGLKKRHIDYKSVCKKHFQVLEKAYGRFDCSGKAFTDFCEANKEWMDDYSFFMFLKTFSENAEWFHWDGSLRNPNSDTMKKYGEKYAKQIGFWKFCQYQFFSQWNSLKKYANTRGIRIIGELPLYAKYDSADVWAHRELFEIDADGVLQVTASCPYGAAKDAHHRHPVPLYNWERMEKDNFSWWQKRIKSAAAMFDVLCIEDFSDIVKFYAEPLESSPEKSGKWHKGPGRKFTDVIEQASKNCKFFVGNLGTVLPGAKRLAAKMGWPVVRILPEAFNGNTADENLPSNYTDTKVVAYAGISGNMSMAGFFRDKTEYELAFLYEYLGIASKEEISDSIIRLAYSSVADVVIMRMRDILNPEWDNGTGLSVLQEVFQWGTGEDGLTEDRRAWLRTLAAIYRR